MTSDRPTSKIRSLLPLVWAALFMVVGILVLIYLGRDTARLMNSPLGDWELKPLLHTESVPTLASLQGKVSLLHFWGTWSPTCRREFPEFVELWETFKDDSRVAIFSISCSPEAEGDLASLREETAAYYQTLGTAIPTFSDPALFTRGRITRMLAAGGFGYPFTMVLDPQGIVRDYWLGDQPGAMEQAERLIRSMLADPLPPSSAAAGSTTNG
jgi:thiol-disulfide isomerase/thioredoxin